MSRPVDMELRKAFVELQHKMIETSQKLRLADIQIEQLKGVITHSQLTEREIKSLPGETKMYQSLGRMFVLSDRGTIESQLQNKVKAVEEKIGTLQNQKSYLETSLKEAENNLREMVQQKRSS
ncbi:unnamed protein product [Darwinula stevensoni]|uniref:Prefoldin subunit 1 n=1 Tax=Darwinula stevensoni TaxID=69355 RepID=A0A7R8XAB0_9CRUS|nr:unnamed protein product [Darwinula stevensoni]CAG0883571.1 unnamed protein product [Darwinula stevensoni]